MKATPTTIYDEEAVLVYAECDYEALYALAVEMRTIIRAFQLGEWVNLSDGKLAAQTILKKAEAIL